MTATYMCKVKVDGEVSDTFEVRTGVRQGVRLSLTLFTLALENVPQKVKWTNLEMNLRVKINTPKQKVLKL